MSNRKLRLSPEVLFQEVSGEMVLLDLESEQYFGLDTVGARIWSLMESGASERELVDRLLAEYEVGRETLEKDVAELLDQLAEAGLIEVLAEESAEP